MANGEPCRECGRQQTDHDHVEHREHPNRRIKGYRCSLASCSGFASEVEPEKPTKEQEQRDNFYLEAMERQGKRRAAFGQYAACVRTINWRNKMRSLNEDVKNARTDDERQTAKTAKEGFLKETRHGGGLYIG